MRPIGHLLADVQRLRGAGRAGFVDAGLGRDGEALVRRRSWFGRTYGKCGLGGGENGAEFAGCERVQGAEAAGKFGGRQAALAAECAQKIVGGGLAFLRVAFVAAGDEVAVGTLSPVDLWRDVVEAAGAWGKLGQAIETVAAFARMNGRAARFH